MKFLTRQAQGFRYYCLALMLLIGCSHQPITTTPMPELPLLSLAPASLGHKLELIQQLQIQHLSQQQNLEVVLSITADKLELVGLHLGLRVLSLQFDGLQLQEQRHPLLPQQVNSQRILRDLILTYWPTQVIQAALPTGWRVQEQLNERRIYWYQNLMMRISYSSQTRWYGHTELHNTIQQYHLKIDSAAL